MQRGNFIYMLIGLLLLVLIGPGLSQLYPDSSNIIINLAFLSVMVVGVWSLNINKNWFMAGISLMIIGLVLSTINIFIESKTLVIVDLFNTLLFCILSMIIAMRHILFGGSITVNKLVGSICIYMLLGIVWALLYEFLSIIDPGAFKGLSLNSDSRDSWNYIYYSFVTLTTLGYGDISPVNHYARALAYIEAICGQIYIAVLVASLVSAHITDRQYGNK